MKIQELGEVRTGQILSRKKSEETTEFLYKVFTLASIEKSGTIQENLIEDFKSNSEIEPSLLTKEGDILIRLSSPYTAVYITKQFENILIPSLVAVIRIKSEEYLPEYVKIYLNSEIAKSQIRKEANGTVIATVTTKSLKELEIPLISIPKQKHLIHYTNAYLEEKQLTEELLKLKEKEYQVMINQSLKDAK